MSCGHGRIAERVRLIEIRRVVGRAAVLLALRRRWCGAEAKVGIRRGRLAEEGQVRVVQRRVDVRQVAAVHVAVAVDVIQVSVARAAARHRIVNCTDW